MIVKVMNYDARNSQDDENSDNGLHESLSNSMFNTDNEDELEDEDLDKKSQSDLGLDLLLNEDYLNTRNKKEQGMERMPYKKESDDEEDRNSFLSKKSSSKGSGSRKSYQQKQSLYNTKDVMSSSAGSEVDFRNIEGMRFGGAPKTSGRMPPSFGSKKKSSMPREKLWDNESEDRDSYVSEISYVSHKKQNHNPDPYEKRQMTADDILNKKQELLFEIDRFEQKGKKYFRKLTIASSLEEIKGAYQKLELDCELDESIQSSRRFIIFVVNIVETICTNSLVRRYLPFELRLSGWSQSVYLEMEKGSYDNVFKKLYIKYRNYTLVSPEVELAGLLFMSGMSFHIGNMFLNNFPILNDAVKANPSFMPQMMNSFSQPMGGSAAMPSQTVGSPPPSAAPGANSGGGGGGGPGMSNLFGMIGTALNMFTGSSGSPVNDSGPPPQRGGVAPPPMPMPRGSPSGGHTEHGAQMKGPGNVDAILQELQSLDNAHDGKLDAISDLESEFSDLPDDMSLSGVFSTKKNNQTVPASTEAAPTKASNGAKRGRPAKSQSATKKTINV